MKVLEKIKVCEDCLFPIVYDDWTALDYHYDKKEAEERMSEIKAGIWRLTKDGSYLACGDSDNGDEFSITPCDCCNSPLHGARHEIILLGE